MSRFPGYQISDDMSQVIASRYAQMASTPEFRDLGAPSLTNTAPSPHQRDVRNMIVAKILEDYAARGTGPVEAMLQDPTATMGSVQGPGPVKLPNSPMALPGGVGGGHVPVVHRHRPSGLGGPVAGGGDHPAPGEAAARTAIDQGAAELAGQDAAAKSEFAKKASERNPQDDAIRRDLN